ncbi:MAG: AAA family ATPase, partial [Myxococcales bacterium]|nr:AAA family ATPase [Myxococcales bacterium]
YEALAGALPFSGGEIEMLQKKLGPPPPVPAGPDVDPQLASLALRLLDKNPATRAAADEVFAELVGDAYTPAPRSELQLIGRETELASLEAALEAARDAPRVVTIRGQPGIGKSSLLAAFEDRLRSRGIAVYAGRCREVESVPFKGIDPAIDQLCSDLSRKRHDLTCALVPEDVGPLMQMFPMFKRIEAFVRAGGEPAGAGSPLRARVAAMRALKELVGKLSAEAPIVIIIDDLQWAGDDTLRLLVELVQPPAPRVLLVCAHRDEHATPMAELAHVDLAIGPLDEGSITAWLTRHHATLSIDSALRETGGHPYLLSRLLELGDGDAPPGGELIAVLSRELAHLAPGARAVLEVISVADGPIRASLALEVAGQPPELAPLDHLRRRKLIRGADHHVEPYHDRVREVVIAETAPERRRAVHHGLAVALEQSGLVAPHALAEHYRAGGDQARAFAWTLRAAALATATFAFARALALYRRAVELAGDDAQRLDALGQLAEAYVLRGELAASADACLEAAALARSLGQGELAASYQTRAGERALVSGQQQRGFELLRDALAEVEVHLPESAAVAVAESFNIGGALAAHGLERPRPAHVDPRLVRRLDLELEVSRALTQTDLRAPLMAARSLDDALMVGDPTRIQRALSLFVLNHAARMPGHPLVVDAEARAHALAVDLADELGMAWAELASGIHAMYLQDFATALADLASAERRFLATPGFAREAALGRMGAIIVCGNYFVDLPHARARSAGFLEEALARGDVYTATWARFVQIHVELAAGRPAVARALLDGIYATFPLDRDSMLSANLINQRIAVALYEDPATAWDEVEATTETYVQLYSSMIPISVQLHGRLTANSALGAWAAGRADREVTLARLDRCVAQLSQLPLAGGHLVVEAHRCRVRGDLAGEREARLRSAELYEASSQHVVAVACRYRACQVDGTEGAAALADEMRALGCADPDRLATLLAGPLPEMRR